MRYRWDKKGALKMHKDNKGKKLSKWLITGTVSLILAVAAIFSMFHMLSEQGQTAGKINNIPSGACSMFLYYGKLYYTDFEKGLYQFNGPMGKGEKLCEIDIAPGSYAFQYNGNIYFSSSSAIYERSIKDGTTRKLLAGEYLGVNAVGGGRLYYTIGYKEPNIQGFTEYEYHIYDLSNGKDDVLFKKSYDQWLIQGIDEQTIVADAYMQSVRDGQYEQNDFGIFKIDPLSGSYSKISAMRSIDGCISGGRFYFIPAINEKGLWGADLDGSNTVQVKLYGMDKPDYMVTSVTNCGDILYAGTHFDGGNHVVSYNLKTGETNVLTDTSSRICKLITDGSALYVYEAEYPYVEAGNIILIPIKQQ